MHMYACMLPPMRTTIEIPDDQRARLLELAARRGEKGFSALVREALELYLRDQ
jgi:predicted DNA-binding protein